MCQALASDPNLAGKKINVMGTSQGGILMRGYLERCNNPPVKNFIAWVSPMMGVYGVPKVLAIIVVVFIFLKVKDLMGWFILFKVGKVEYLNVTLDAIADCCVYDDWAQDLFSFAGYWRGIPQVSPSRVGLSSHSSRMRRRSLQPRGIRGEEDLPFGHQQREAREESNLQGTHPVARKLHHELLLGG